jgi:hypothetical protein
MLRFALEKGRVAGDRRNGAEKRASNHGQNHNRNGIKAKPTFASQYR